MTDSNDVVRGWVKAVGPIGPHPSHLIEMQGELTSSSKVVVLPVKPDGSVGPVEPWMAEWLNGDLCLGELYGRTGSVFGSVEAVDAFIATALSQILGGQDG